MTEDNREGRFAGRQPRGCVGSELPEQVDAATWEAWSAKRMQVYKRATFKDEWILTGPARVRNWKLFTPDWASLAEHDSMPVHGLVALSVGLLPQYADPNWVFHVALPYFQGEREETELPFAEDSAEQCAEAARKLDTFIRRLQTAASWVNARTLQVVGADPDGEPWVHCNEFARYAAAKGWSLPADFPWSAPAEAGEPARALERTEAPAAPAPAAAQQVAPAPLEQPAVPAGVARIVTHSTKPRRRDDLWPAIEEAQHRCSDPFDVRQVWNVMCRLADDEFPPLLAATDDGIKYRGSDKPLTLKLLRERLRGLRKRQDSAG